MGGNRGGWEGEVRIGEMGMGAGLCAVHCQSVLHTLRRVVYYGTMGIGDSKIFREGVCFFSVFRVDL